MCGLDLNPNHGMESISELPGNRKTLGIGSPGKDIDRRSRSKELGWARNE